MIPTRQSDERLLWALQQISKGMTLNAAAVRASMAAPVLRRSIARVLRDDLASGDDPDEVLAAYPPKASTWWC